MLFQHYLTHTAPMLYFEEIGPNPFITNVLPMMQTDPLLMHAVAALSGSHIRTRPGTSGVLTTVTLHHYSKLLQGIQATIASGGSRMMGNLPLTVALTCAYEVGYKMTIV